MEVLVKTWWKQCPKPVPQSFVMRQHIFSWTYEGYIYMSTKGANFHSTSFFSERRGHWFKSCQRTKCSEITMMQRMEALIWNRNIISSALEDFRFNNNWHKFKWSIFCRQPSLNNLLLISWRCLRFRTCFSPSTNNLNVSKNVCNF